jgi:hypothetical protein
MFRQGRARSGKLAHVRMTPQPPESFAPPTASKPALFLRAMALGCLLVAAFGAVVAADEPLRWRVWNHGWSPTPACLGGIVFVLMAFTALAPTTRAGRIARRLAIAPAAGFALIVLAETFVRGGHPSLGALLWIGTAYASLGIVPAMVVLLAVAWMRGDHKVFAAGGIVFAALTALYSLPIL